MEIRYSKAALKALTGYDKPTQKRIRWKVRGLTKSPPEGDIKPLTGRGNEHRLRIGKYRVIYEYITEKQIKILLVNDIDSRGDIYK